MKELNDQIITDKTNAKELSDADLNSKFIGVLDKMKVYERAAEGNKDARRREISQNRQLNEENIKMHQMKRYGEKLVETIDSN